MNTPGDDIRQVYMWALEARKRERRDLVFGFLVGAFLLMVLASFILN